VFPWVESGKRIGPDPVKQGILTMLMNRPIAWLATLFVAVAMATDVNAQGLPTSAGQEPFFRFKPLLDNCYFNL
jgi:hypothetical protein